MQIFTCNDKHVLGKKASHHGADLIREAIEARGSANIILATGASQQEMLQHLTRAADIHWPAVTVFHLDEYVGMPITHPASFRLYLWQRFVSRLPLPLGACHYIDGEHDAKRECGRVGAILAQHPIDVAFVGIGENGHMAFNDPPADFETHEPFVIVDLDERCRMQQVGEGCFESLDDVPPRAISMSINQIMSSRAIIASIPDLRKAEAVKNSVENAPSPMYPSTCLQRHERAYLYLDVHSASLLALGSPV